jgi:hypothetical protein
VPREFALLAGILSGSQVRFIITNLHYSSKNIKEWKVALKGTRLSCRSFNANAVRLQLHALGYNLGNFLRTLATPEAIAEWTLTSLREKLIKIGARVVSHGRYVSPETAGIVRRRLE